MCVWFQWLVWRETGRVVVAVRRRRTLMPMSSWLSLVVEGATGTVDCCFEHASQTPFIFCPPRDGHTATEPSREGV